MAGGQPETQQQGYNREQRTAISLGESDNNDVSQCQR